MKLKWLLMITIYSICALCFSKNSQPISHSGYLSVSGTKLYYQSFGIGRPIIVLHGGPGLDQILEAIG